MATASYHKKSKEEYCGTFLFSNIAPQKRNLKINYYVM